MLIPKMCSIMDVLRLTAADIRDEPRAVPTGRYLSWTSPCQCVPRCSGRPRWTCAGVLRTLAEGRVMRGVTCLMPSLSMDAHSRGDMKRRPCHVCCHGTPVATRSPWMSHDRSLSVHQSSPQQPPSFSYTSRAFSLVYESSTSIPVMSTPPPLHENPTFS